MPKVYKVRGEWRVRFDDGTGKKREYVIPVRTEKEARRLADRAERKVSAARHASKTSRGSSAARPFGFEITVNGRKARIVGTKGFGRVSIHLEYALDNPDRWRGSTRRRFDVDPILHLNALDRSDSQFDRGVSWPALKLREGDEITVRIVADATPDRPSSSHRMRPLLLLA